MSSITLKQIQNKYIERFWSKVKKGKDDDCWEWQSSCDSKGYGQSWVPGITPSSIIRSSRFSYIVAYGYIPKDAQVLHKCDNPPCVNPKHLFLGTNLDNIKDRVSKGRSVGGFAKGERNINAKLSLEDVEAIRKEYVRGKTSYAKIGKKYGVREHAIRGIINGTRWKNK